MTVPTNGLIAEYLGTVSGGQLLDTAGSDLHGTVVGTVTSEAEGHPLGPAAVFGGAGGVNLPTAAMVAGAGARTVALWFYRATNASTYETLYSAGAKVTSQLFDITIGPGTLEFVNYGNNTTVPHTYNGAWQFICFQYDGATKRGWIGNVLKVDQTTTLNTATSYHEVAQRQALQRFNGKLARLRIWDRALSDSEIADVFFEGKQRYAVPELITQMVLPVPVMSYQRIIVPPALRTYANLKAPQLRRELREPRLAHVAYRCTIGGVEVPLRGFQTQLSEDGMYWLQCYLPYSDSVFSAVQANPTATVRVYRGLVMSDNTIIWDEIAQGALSRVNSARGVNSQTVTVEATQDGYANEAPQSVTIRGIQTVSTDSGRYRVRSAEINRYLRPGDVVSGEIFPAFRVGRIYHALQITNEGRPYEWMEVQEAQTGEGVFS